MVQQRPSPPPHWPVSKGHVQCRVICVSPKTWKSHLSWLVSLSIENEEDFPFRSGPVAEPAPVLLGLNPTQTHIQLGEMCVIRPPG